uniref:Neuropeptides capa receptor-like isoform X1 n=1 Tax=Diabrotica virgifera virgifera TaxID=50390 RepID=A0A6P7GH40_DIAVI
MSNNDSNISDVSNALFLCIEQAETSTNISANPWQLINCFRGPQMQDLGIAVAVTVINGIILFTGLLGNIFVCVVIIRHKSLHSTTEYYLLNLAVSDLTLLIFGLPYDVTLFWHQYPWTLGDFCCKARALISETASYVSVLTVVAFSTERYLAICHPLYTMVITNLQRSLRIISGLWIISLLCAIPFAYYSGVDFISYPFDSDNIIPQSAFCAMTSQPEYIPLAEISTIIFFFLPLMIIIFQYIKMGMIIRETTKKGYFYEEEGTGTVTIRNNRQIRHRHNVIKMLSYVVFGFFISWCPFHTQRILSIYLNNHSHFDELNYWLYITAGVFYYSSSTLNPILYNVMSEKMRNAFKEVICGWKIDPRSSRASFVKSDTSYLNTNRDTYNSVSQVKEEDKLQLVKKNRVK